MTECRLLKRFAKDPSVQDDDVSPFKFLRPLRTIAYVIRPITGPSETLDEFFEKAHKRQRLN